ncbi:MAG: CHRD domain-containing protein, partial [Thermoplasmata archaeon]|nr:CHRD domain-containing protein [Thermoplasmata archaeon]
AVAFNVGSAAADGRKVGVFEVTITNLTSGQPFTPPVLATHKKSTGIFEVGEAASLGVQEVAENGNPAPLLASLAANRRVFDSTAGSAPLVPMGNPGEVPFSSSGSYVVVGPRGARLSVISMLICTNDGFTGVDGLKLPKKVGDTVTAYAQGYDAGTEINTEDFADMVPPCPPLTGVTSTDAGTGMTDPALAEGGVIHHHPGVDGVGVGMMSDLTFPFHNWANPVAKIEVTRHANIRIPSTDVEIEAEFEFDLTGAQEVPAVATDASGEAEVELEIEDGDVELEVELEVCDIEGVVAAHIHGPAGPGVNAGVMLGLFGGGPFSADDDCEELVDREWDEDDLEAELTVPLSDFVAALVSGNAYINVHTLTNLPGEIRGQAELDEIEIEVEFPLAGHQEVPRVLTGAWGEGEVEFEWEDGDFEFEFELEVCDIEDVTQAHIHIAPAGSNGPVVLFLFGPAFGSPFSADGCEELSEGEFSQAELEAALIGISLEDFLAALATGNAYVNVHTVANPAGEIRGQIG